MVEDDNKVDFQDPSFVRLASYLAAAGKTWKDKDTGKLKTIIRARFLPIIYPLFREFFPTSKLSILGSQKEVKGKYIEHITYRLDDHDILEMIEAGGFKLGSKHRKPPVYILKNPVLVKAYLKVIWEVHGKVCRTDPLKICIEQRYPQELRELQNWFNCSEIFCVLTQENGNNYLYFTDPKSIKGFFDLMDWEPDSEFGRQKMGTVIKHLPYSVFDSEQEFEHLLDNWRRDHHGMERT